MSLVNMCEQCEKRRKSLTLHKNLLLDIARSTGINVTSIRCELPEDEWAELIRLIREKLVEQ